MNLWLSAFLHFVSSFITYFSPVVVGVDIFDVDETK
jgi:hypothetical protein